MHSRVPFPPALTAQSKHHGISSDSNGAAQSQVAACSSYAVLNRLLVNFPTNKSHCASSMTSTVVSIASCILGLVLSPAAPLMLLSRLDLSTASHFLLSGLAAREK